MKRFQLWTRFTSVLISSLTFEKLRHKSVHSTLQLKNSSASGNACTTCCFLDSTGETAPRQRFNPSTASRVDTSTRQLRGSNIALDMPNIGNTTSPRPYLSQQVRKLGQQFNVLISKNYAQFGTKRVLNFHEFFLVL